MVLCDSIGKGTSVVGRPNVTSTWRRSGQVQVDQFQKVYFLCIVTRCDGKRGRSRRISFSGGNHDRIQTTVTLPTTYRNINLSDRRGISARNRKVVGQGTCTRRGTEQSHGRRNRCAVRRIGKRIKVDLRIVGAVQDGLEFRLVVRGAEDKTSAPDTISAGVNWDWFLGAQQRRSEQLGDGAHDNGIESDHGDEEEFVKEL